MGICALNLPFCSRNGANMHGLTDTRATPAPASSQRALVWSKYGYHTLFLPRTRCATSLGIPCKKSMH